MKTLIYHSVSYNKKRAPTATWKSWFIAAFVVVGWLLGVQSVLAQNYPVQSTVQLAPPYSTYLADYVAPGTNRLSINVLLTELDRVEYPVKLRVTIEGGGVTLRTHDRYAPAPITLQGGMLEMLTAVDLAPYFDPMNLQFSGGLRSDQFQRTGQLPEGFYRFCVEVLDYNSGTVVSNTGCASAWLILNEPPLINLPQADSKVRAQEPPNLIFQWTPRHLGSPNAAFTTEYELTLVELWPANRNPNDAVLSTVPLFQTTTTSTTYVYGMADPPLEPGRRYAFRIQARSMSGIEALDLFKNQGYSEVVSFTYGDACVLPTQLTADVLSATRLKLAWHTGLVHTGYTVRYREANSRTSRWVEETSYLDAVTLSGLKPNTEYEYQLKGLCGTLTGDYTPVARVRTLPQEDNPMVCGLPSPDFDLGNQSQLEYLYPGDYLSAGDFDVQITEVQASSAGFSGSGIAEMPLLSLARVRVAFDNIQVNTDYRVIDGNVYSLGDPTEGGVLDLDEGGAVVLHEDNNETPEAGDVQQDSTSVNDSFHIKPKDSLADTTANTEEPKITSNITLEETGTTASGEQNDEEGETKKPYIGNDTQPLGDSNETNLSKENETFGLDGFWAIDGKNTNRRAKQDEILYLVYQQLRDIRNIKYELESKAVKENFLDGEPIWQTSNDINISVDESLKKGESNTGLFPGSYTANVTAFSNVLSANIELVERDFEKAKIPLLTVENGNASDPITNTIKNFRDAYKKIDDILKYFQGKKKDKQNSESIEFKEKFEAEIYNEHQNVEHKDSPFYYREKKVGGSVKFGKGTQFDVSGFSYPPAIELVYIKLFCDADISVEADVSNRYKKEIDENDYKPMPETLVVKTFLGGNVKAGIKGGVDLKLLEGQVIGESETQVGGTYSYQAEKADGNKNRIVVGLTKDLVVRVKLKGTADAGSATWEKEIIIHEEILFKKEDFQLDPLEF